MEAWSAFVSIMAIVAIVVVAGGLIAFIGHMVIGAFDNGKQSVKKQNKDVIDYSQYKQLENSMSVSQDEYNFEAINESKARKEQEMLKNAKETIFELEEDKNEELEVIENRLKSVEIPDLQESKVEQPKVNEVKPEEPKVENVVEDEEDDFDLDNLLNEISNDVIEEEKSEVKEEIKMSDELASYSIDDLLRQAEEDVIEETEELPEEVDDVEEDIQIPDLIEDFEDEQEEVEEELEVVEEVKVLPQAEVAQLEYRNSRDAEVEALKAQLEELNKQLQEARSAKVEVVSINTTEEECIARLEMLEERLKNVKKDHKINAKEYRPLKKVMNDLERYQTKLRRKETVVAKKKVALYGVNNYVDIDKEKAEKLANELELLDGLRLSVSHCEAVINANKDRFPVLEHTNQILEDQIAHIEADIASTQEILKKIREKNGNGEGSNGNK